LCFKKVTQEIFSELDKTKAEPPNIFRKVTQAGIDGSPPLLLAALMEGGVGTLDQRLALLKVPKLEFGQLASSLWCGIVQEKNKVYPSPHPPH
jgi:hypothetical protein